jgi:predicted DCC family thiol-disulfide oxidoreductase YuxK
VEPWRYLVLYDGECGLCDRSIQWLLRHDRKGLLRFAPLQGATARPFVEGPLDELATVLYVERDAEGQPRVWERSAAAFRILWRLGGGWRVVAWLRVLPRALTDAVYRFVARRRRRWFGTVDACRAPDAAARARFLP